MSKAEPQPPSRESCGRKGHFLCAEIPWHRASSPPGRLENKRETRASSLRQAYVGLHRGATSSLLGTVLTPRLWGNCSREYSLHTGVWVHWARGSGKVAGETPEGRFMLRRV